MATDIKGELVTEGRKFQPREEYNTENSHDEGFQSVLNIHSSSNILGSQVNFEGGIRYFEQLNGREEETDSYVNEFYIDKYFDNHQLSFGRKKVRWGAGYVLSPIDVITPPPSPVDPEDRFYNIQGRDLIQYSWSAPSSSIELMLVKGEDDSTHIESDALYGRFYTNHNSTDYALIGGVSEDDGYILGGNITTSIGQSLELHLEVGYDSERPARKPGITGLGSLKFPKESHISAVAGGQWSTEEGFNFNFEYLFFQNGLDNKEVENLLELTKDNTGSSIQLQDSKLLQSNYVFLRFAKDDVFKNWDSSLTGFISTESSAGIYKYELTREYDSGLSIYGELYKIHSDDNEEFSLITAEHGINLGLKYAF